MIWMTARLRGLRVLGAEQTAIVSASHVDYVVTPRAASFLIQQGYARELSRIGGRRVISITPAGIDAYYNRCRTARTDPVA